jgi:hypothetical protein
MTKVHHAQIQFTWRARPSRRVTPDRSSSNLDGGRSGDSIGICLDFSRPARALEREEGARCLIGLVALLLGVELYDPLAVSTLKRRPGALRSWSTSRS